MNEQARKARNAKALEECAIWFRVRLSLVIAELENLHLRPRIQQAWRSLVDQEKAVQDGNSQVHFGYHNVTGPSGEKQAFAVDLLDDDDPLMPGTVYLLKLAWAAERHELRTLVRWGLGVDQSFLIDRAIVRQNFDMPVMVGKDPCHVQPGPLSGITIDRLRSGWRPL